MNSRLDRRTRRDANARFVTPEAFFANEFPVLAARNGKIATAAIKALNAPPLTIEVGGSAWTIQLQDDALILHEGTLNGALVITLSPEQFSDLAQNQMGFNGFMTSRAVAFRDGSLTDISIWDSVWIALLEGWSAVDGGLTFTDRQGALLDLTRIFTPNDDPADIAHFLSEAGFLHLRGWLDPADMVAISAEMDRALPLYSEGDGKSWWAGMSDGSRRCVRLQEFVDHSPTTQRILSSASWDHMRSVISGEDELARVPVEGRIIEALFKPVGVVSGPSDVSFHRDCHLGRHAYVCARRTIGISVTQASEDNGLLRVFAGSHRVAMPVEIAKTKPYLPMVALPTEPGDLSVHLSCTLHEATPPKIAERRVMYTEIPLVPLAGSAAPVDTSEAILRERVTDILRDTHEKQNGI